MSERIFLENVMWKKIPLFNSHEIFYVKLRENVKF